MVKMCVNLLLVLLSVVILESCSGYPIEGITVKDKLLENTTAVEILPSSTFPFLSKCNMEIRSSKRSKRKSRTSRTKSRVE
ncbi:hypothetical protein TNIN_43711 [Trichonephila inaurata madagascariensis]|uniref:Uncharacterized protein n=1 Tax=Trichonephila inaurata madagascariensis TaxID=2747483 RepID=A0A8X6YDL9_9ARAC|nr:hypothetical protein TNIN_43711 [Trichonephila inaurata madagascariensis]